MSDLLDDLAAIAEAEAAHASFDDLCYRAKSRAEREAFYNPMESGGETDDLYDLKIVATYLSFIDNTLTAFIALAKADDPEPPCFIYDDWGLSTNIESPLHIAWRIRQEAHTALESALEANR